MKYNFETEATRPQKLALQQTVDDSAIHIAVHRQTDNRTVVRKRSVSLTNLTAAGSKDVEKEAKCYQVDEGVSLEQFSKCIAQNCLLEGQKRILLEELKRKDNQVGSSIVVFSNKHSTFLPISQLLFTNA